MYRKMIIDKINTIEEVPTMLDTAIKVEALTRNPDVDVNDVEHLIKLDPVLTMKVMKLANSVVYASTKRVVSLNQVISRLGLGEIRKLAMSLAVMNCFDSKYVNYEQFWTHSITCAFVAQHLHNLVKPNDKNLTIFSSGILHDIGVLVLDQYFPDLYKKVFDVAKKRNIALYLIEEKVLSISHAEVAALLLKNWNIPDDIIEPIMYHHNPRRAKKDNYNTNVLYIANFICDNQGIDNGTGFFPEGFDEDIWESLGLSVQLIPGMIRNALKDTEKAKQLIEIGM